MSSGTYITRPDGVIQLFPASGRDGGRQSPTPRAPSTPSRTRVLTRQQQLHTKGGLGITGEGAVPFGAVAELRRNSPLRNARLIQAQQLYRCVRDEQNHVDRLRMLVSYGYDAGFVFRWLGKWFPQD